MNIYFLIILFEVAFFALLIRAVVRHLEHKYDKN